MEVHALDQQPEEVGHDEVLEKHQTGFTSHLENTQVQSPSLIPRKCRNNSDAAEQRHLCTGIVNKVGRKEKTFSVNYSVVGCVGGSGRLPSLIT